MLDIEIYSQSKHSKNPTNKDCNTEEPAIEMKNYKVVNTL